MKLLVVGIPGSGKSTFISGLERNVPKSIVIPENFQDNLLLRPFMLQPLGIAFSLQLEFLVNYILAWEARFRDNSNCLTVIDAGVPTNWHVFTHNQMEMHLISRTQYKNYEVMAKMMMLGARYPEADIVAHIITPSKTCLARIKKRDRDFEREISLSYLNSLDRHTHRMVRKYKKRGIPVIDVDNDNLDMRDVEIVKPLARAILEIQNAKVNLT